MTSFIRWFIVGFCLGVLGVALQGCDTHQPTYTPASCINNCVDRKLKALAKIYHQQPSKDTVVALIVFCETYGGECCDALGGVCMEREDANRGVGPQLQPLPGASGGGDE